MAVRLLAGPFRIKDDEGVLPVDMRVNAYYPGVGILAFGHYAYYGTTNTHRITLDGVSQLSPLSGEVTFNNPGFSWWPGKRQMVTFFFFGGGEYTWEPKTMLAQIADPPEDRWLTDPPIYMFVGQYVRLWNRWVYLYGSSLSGVRLNQPSHTEVLWPWNAFGGCFPGRTEVEVMGTSPPDGMALFYDCDTGQFTTHTIFLGMAANKILFAPEWGVIISAHNAEVLDDEHTGIASPVIRIWSLEVNPQLLTDPVPYIGTPKSGQIVTYRVQLVGAQNDPAENELINWEVTGAGALLDLQTKTDWDGYATARVQYLVGETGDSTVTASVQC